MTMNLTLECAAIDGHRWTCPAVRADSPIAGLIWLPALGVPAQKYQVFAESLARMGITTVVHEWRGLASSSLRASRQQDWGYRDLVENDISATAASARQVLPGTEWLVGGHSIGGQFAALALAHQPSLAKALVLIATGVPHAATYPARHRLLIAMFARFIPMVTRVCGFFPGDRLKWAGREAATLMEQWAGTVRTGHYNGVGLGEDLEQRLGRTMVPTLGLRMDEDWLVPTASLDMLIGKLGPGPVRREEFDSVRLGAVADHFRWLRKPDALATVIGDWARGLKLH